MKRGKLIVIEGTDCSGKETQSKKLIERLNNEGINTIYYSFPNYSSPSGRIVGLSYLGKPYLAKELVYNHEEEIKNTLKDKLNDKYDEEIINVFLDVTSEKLGCGWFNEGAPNVNSKISSLYYAADRGYNIEEINKVLDSGTNIILDRYIYSNMAHQGGKYKNKRDRSALYKWIDKLELKMLGLPEADFKLFLHMPTDFASFLRKGRDEALDENERDINHLKNAEKAYLEVASKYNFNVIECVRDNSVISMDNIKSIDEINEEVYKLVKEGI